MTSGPEGAVPMTPIMGSIGKLTWLNVAMPSLMGIFFVR